MNEEKKEKRRKPSLNREQLLHMQRGGLLSTKGLNLLISMLQGEIMDYKARRATALPVDGKKPVDGNWDRRAVKDKVKLKAHEEAF
jgi:hypothetical protein